MEPQDDPYSILGVPPNASESQIRTAYRKAALRTHPDKVPEEERPQATRRFAKISNAYEILSDSQKRAQYDQEQQQMNYNGASDFDHPFFAHHYHGGFHDPFQVFQSVFREEFGGSRTMDFNSSRHGGSHPRRQHVSPLFDSFFGGGGGMMGGDPFFGGGGGPDPFDDFFGGGSMFGGPSRGFGRGGGMSRRRATRDPFDDMFDSMRGMQQQIMEQQQSQNPYQIPGGIQQSFYYSSSSTNSRGGESVTTQTTRRIVNGQEETFTERIVRKADGTVERQVLDNNNNRLAGRLPEDSTADAAAEDSRAGFSRLLPWRRRNSKQAEDMTPAKRSPAEQDMDSQKRRREP